MKDTPRLTLIFTAAALVLVAGIAAFVASSEKEESSGEKGFSMSPAANDPHPRPSKANRPIQKELRDGGGLQPMSKEWFKTEAGKAFIAEMKQKQLRPGMKVIDHLDPGVHAQIREGMEMIYRYSSRDPQTDEPTAAPVGDWKEGIERLKGVISFMLGRHGNDPRLVFIDPEFFLYCHEEASDFSRGYAVRKEDGAVFQWKATNAVTSPSP